MSRVVLVLVGLLALVISSGGVVLAARGGPDAGGYTYVDNADPRGPQFGFLDISGGTDIGSACDDCVVSNVSIGFSFVFYGVTYTTMNISSNGNIQFTTSNTAFSNTALPTSTFGPAIVPFWDDLQTNCTTTDAIFRSTTGAAPSRVTFVQWRMTPHFPCQTGDITFQAILFEGSNDILFVYPDTFFSAGSANNDGASATIGIQRDSSTALQYSFNTASVPSGRAICFDAPTAAVGVPSQNACSLSFAAPIQPTVRPNISGAFAGGATGTERNLARQAQANAAAQQAAAAAAGAAAAGPTTGGLLRPPSTGDGGLIDRDRTTSDWSAPVVALTVFSLITVAVLGKKWDAQQR